MNKTRRLIFLFLVFSLLMVSCSDSADSSDFMSEHGEQSVFESFESFESSDTLSPSEGEDVWISDESEDDSSAEEAVNVSYVASTGGYLSGSLKQTLKKDEVTKEVSAAATLCYAFKGWSDGVTDPVRKGETFSEDTVITAIFEYVGLPEIHIEYNKNKGISRSRPTDATFTVKNACTVYEFESAVGQIQGRGNSTWNHAKKPYKIKFEEAVNLLGIGDNAKKDWVLLSNHGDQSLFRNYYAYNLAYRNGIGYKSTLVEVYLNGKYNGVYMLTGKVEESRLGVETEEGGFIVELDNYYSGKVNVDYVKAGRYIYTLKSDYIDKNQMNTIKNTLIEVEEAIKEADETKIKELLDIESCVNMYLLQEYMKNTDVGWSSFYLYKKDGEDKLTFGPAWDFDIAMGNDYRLDKGSYENIYVGRYSGFTQQNWWYIHLCRMDWFRELVLDRWNNGFKEIAENLLSQLKEYASINMEELEGNFDRWQIFGKRINSEPTHIMALDSYAEHYNFLIAWLELRFRWLDDCFNNSDIWLKEINDRTYPQYKGGKIPEI